MVARILFTVVLFFSLCLIGCGGGDGDGKASRDGTKKDPGGDVSAAFKAWEKKYAGDPYAGEVLPITDEALAALPANVPELEIRDGSKLTDAGMAHLAKQTEMTSFAISESPISDEGLKHISGMTKLKALYIFKCNEITDDGLAVLKSLPSITSLSVAGDKLTEKWIGHAIHLDLAEFLTFGVKLTDVGLEHIGHFTRLTEIHLDLDREHATDKGGVHLGKLKEVESLQLSFCKIGDGTLEALKGHPKLKSLTLIACSNVSHEGIRHLGSLPALETLELIYDDMSGPGLADLKNAPNLKHLRITHLKPENAKYLAELNQLKSLSFMEGVVHQETLDAVAKMDNLKTLELTFTNVKSLEPLAGMTGLTELYLADTPMTDEGFAGVSKLVNLELLHVGDKVSSMEPIRNLKKLQRLSLGKMVDDRCLEIILSLPELKWIRLTDSNVTEAGKKKIKEAFPDASVLTQF